MADLYAYSPPLIAPRQENDFIIKELNIIAYNGEAYDINNIRHTVNIYESLFSNFVYGDITLVDSVDLPRLLPIIGEEKLKFIFTRPDETSSMEGAELPVYEAVFRVFNMSNRFLDREKRQVYTLHFVSQELFKSINSAVYKTYKGFLYSDIVKDIFDTHIKINRDLEAEATKYLQDYAAPGQKPYQVINALAAMSISAKNNHQNFMFFEDMEKFSYKTLASLIEAEPACTYYYRPANILKQDSQAPSRTIERDMYSAEAYKFNGSFDVISNSIAGLYASKLITFDPIRKRYEVIEFGLKDKFNEFIHTDKNTPYTDALESHGNPNARIRYVCTNKDHDTLPWITNLEPGIKPKHVEEYVLERASLMRQIENARALMDVSGDPRRRVGQTVFFDLPAAMGKIDKNNPQEPDKYLYGKYLITCLRHRLYPNKYSCEMQIVKDSFFESIEHIDPTELYKDVF